MSNWLAHWWHWAADGVLMVMFVIAWVVAIVEARGRDRAEEEAADSFNAGYDAGWADKSNETLAQPAVPEWQPPETFYQPEPEPVSAWAIRLEDERMAWCQRVGIPFEDADVHWVADYTSDMTAIDKLLAHPKVRAVQYDPAGPYDVSLVKRWTEGEMWHG